MGAPPVAMTDAILAAAATAALAVIPIVGWILIGIGLATSVGGVGYVVYKTGKGYHMVINCTDAVLDFAIKEVLQWQVSPHHEDNSTEAVSKEKKLELLGKYENLTRS
jgi:hypothetical protein